FPSALYATPPELTAQDVEPFLDGVMAAHAEEHHVSGAVIAIVKNNEVLFSKGYGYANIEEKKPVDPEKTLFRVGSITKTFIWTTVMQLVEAGQLDLDEDINTYLKFFKIPEAFSQPITMRHLMTHTPGFEDKVIGLFSYDSESVEPALGDILKADMPARVYPPGEVPAYSNYGSALAAHIVELISGKPFPDHLKEVVLQPLDMQRTTLWQPVSAELRADLATGYRYAGGRYHSQPFELVPLAPAGALSTTAIDMTKFMLAHLQGGANILTPETAALLHSSEVSKGLAQGRMHGFYDTNINGLQTFGHGGDTIYFHSQMILVLEHQLGLFLSYSSPGGASARDTLIDAFFDRYFPAAEQTVLPTSSGFQRRAGRLAGTYQFSRRNHSSFEKLISIAGYSLAEVSVTDNNTLMIHGTEWVELEPLLFRRLDGLDKLHFEADAAGNITGMHLENAPMLLYKKLDWRENPGLHALFLGIALLFAAIAILMLFRNMFSEPVVALITRRLAAINGVLCLVFFGGVIGTMGALNEAIVFGLPWYFSVLFILPWLIVCFTVPLLLMTLIFAWPGGYWTMLIRLFYTAFALLSVGLIFFMKEWNLLNYFF
ncbi:MAG: serine hydrolase domain-containing protein, partial [Pseudomonadota bacterium]